MSKDQENLKKTNDYIDLLGQHPKFVVFTKEDRIQLIVEPSKEQIRKRGKAKWKIALVTNDVEEALKSVRAAVGNLVYLPGYERAPSGRREEYRK